MDFTPTVPAEERAEALGVCSEPLMEAVLATGTVPQADLITANLHAIPRGAESVELTDYEDWHEDGHYGTVTVSLDPRLRASSRSGQTNPARA